MEIHLSRHLALIFSYHAHYIALILFSLLKMLFNRYNIFNVELSTRSSLLATHSGNEHKKDQNKISHDAFDL